MARIDDYKRAREIAVERLAGMEPTALARQTGFPHEADGSLVIPFLDRRYRVRLPGFDFSDPAALEREVPLQEQVLILHYLLSGSPPLCGGSWIAYREIPGAAFYFSAFVKRAIDPLKKAFGDDPGRLSAAARRIGAQAVETGDAAFEFAILPGVTLQVILWGGDDEFGPEASILFQETIGEIFSPEDAAWLAGMLVYRLVALAR